MKKIFLTLSILGAFSFFAKAQLNGSAGLTYTNYGGDISKASPGVHLRGSYYLREKYGVGLGLSYSLPINSTYGNGDAMLKRKSSFMAISALATLHLIGSSETDFSLYFPVGASYQIGKSKYTVSANQPLSKAAIEDEKLDGLTINASIGLQYRIGNPYIFAEAGFALAANNTSNTRTGVTGNNPAPGSTVLQLGIRFPFGAGGGIY